MTFLSPSDITNEKHFDHARRSRNHRSRKASPRVERSVSRDPSEVPPKHEPKVDNVDKEAFFDLIKSLDRKVRTSSTKEVQDTDADMVSRIKTHAQAWISSGNFLDCFQDLEVREVPGVMKRVEVYQGEGITCRFHLFEDPTETYIHNHQSNFFSSCLKGHYWHRIWGTDQNQNKHHYALNRSKGHEKAERQAGALYIQHANDHVEGASYFIHSNTPHTVLPHLDGARPVPVVTMLIKGKKAVRDTLVRSENLGIEQRREEDKKGERELHQSEKFSVLERMHRLMSGWTPNQKKSDRGRSRRKEQAPNHDVNPILIFHACV